MAMTKTESEQAVIQYEQSTRLRLENARLRRENNLLHKKLKEVSEVIHNASKSLYELEFGMGPDGVGDLDTGKEGVSA